MHDQSQHQTDPLAGIIYVWNRIFLFATLTEMGSVLLFCVIPLIYTITCRHLYKASTANALFIYLWVISAQINLYEQIDLGPLGADRLLMSD